MRKNAVLRHWCGVREGEGLSKSGVVLNLEGFQKPSRFAAKKPGIFGQNGQMARRWRNTAENDITKSWVAEMPWKEEMGCLWRVQIYEKVGEGSEK